MTLLLDTHVILWFWWSDPQLSATAEALISNPANRKWVSPASPWEVAIKISRKKLDIGVPYRGYFDQHMLRNNFEWLPIITKHVDFVADLPFHHNDPFDRLLIAQAIAENVPIVSADPAFDKYPIQRLW